ncbi:MAG: TonB-dependent receptor, partial [Tannerellaceae bacterium]|nr:TonB-dependent receptor [Tannerellaceae bacterium]
IKENHIVISANPVKQPNDEKNISGIVINELGEPVIGANVIEKGTINGVITDIDGIFNLKTHENATILLSYIGYMSQEFIVGKNTQYRIILKEDSKTLEEVVIVSYGTQKKRDMTGAITSVKADALADLPVGQIGQKLQGQVAGVQINQSTGAPGQGMAFRIRGAVSINNNSQPLIVVDGFPISAGLNNINPDEIESFTVLKDAAATSLYGSRAGNGVILITTKRGKKGKLDVKLQANVGIQTLNGLKDMNVMNGREFAQFKKEYFEDAIKWGKRDPDLGVPEQYQNPEQYGEGTNWYKLITQNALTQNYSLGLSGGTDAIATAVTFGYFKQEGVVKNSGFERMTLRTNNDFRVNERIKIGLNVSPMVQLYHNQQTDGDRQILSGAMIADPTESPYDKDGNLRISISPAEGGTGLFPQVNWIRAVTERKANHHILTVLANTFVDIDIWGGIKYRFQAGTDMEWRKYREWTPSTAAGSWISPPPGKASAKYNNENYYTWNIENMLTFDRTFNDHTIGALAGYSSQQYRKEKAEISGSEFPDDEVEWITEALTTRQGKTEMTEWTIASWLARIDYNYKNKYLLQGNIRRDGSSRFGAGHKWATFPSVSAGWIVSEESFMERTENIMNYLKLRVSYGVTGNYNIGDYTHLATVVSANYPIGGEVAPGKGLAGIGNRELTWEENTQFDIGVDFGFLNDRIFLMYDYYQKNTKMLLNEMEIPWTSGFDKVMSNMGEIKSWGHEISIESRNMVGSFKWKTNLNMTFNRNKVIKISTMSNHIGGDSEHGNWNRLEVGQPVGIFMGYVFDGVYMNQEQFDSQPKHATSQVGSVRMKDISGPDGIPDGIIDINDRTKIGDPNPDMIFGITNEFRWKNFDLSILFTGQIGGDIFAGCFENTLNLDGVFNVLKDVKNRWRSEENPGNGKIPSTMLGSTDLYRTNHSGWVYDGTHLTLKNITFGYTIPFKRNSFVSGARVYFSAQQLFTLCDYPGLNPQVANNNELGWNGMGVDRTTYPIPRTFSVGCNINF